MNRLEQIRAESSRIEVRVENLHTLIALADAVDAGILQFPPCDCGGEVTGCGRNVECRAIASVNEAMDVLHEKVEG